MLLHMHHLLYHWGVNTGLSPALDAPNHNLTAAMSSPSSQPAADMLGLGFGFGRAVK
jgi:hypothetical protein